MEEEKKKAYSEVVEILKLIEDEEKIEKIPFEVIELIKSNADFNYKPTIDKDKPLEEQNLKDETYIILAWIASKYWDEEIAVNKPKIENITDTADNLLPQAAVYNDMEPQLLALCDELGIVPIISTDKKWYSIIKEKVIKILRILFRTKKDEKETQSSNL